MKLINIDKTRQKYVDGQNRTLLLLLMSDTSCEEKSIILLRAGLNQWKKAKISCLSMILYSKFCLYNIKIHINIYFHILKKCNYMLYKYHNIQIQFYFH